MNRGELLDNIWFNVSSNQLTNNLLNLINHLCFSPTAGDSLIDFSNDNSVILQQPPFHNKFMR